MATYSTAIRYVQGFNVASSGTTINFTVSDNQYYQVTAIGLAGGASTVTVSLSGVQIYSGSQADSHVLNGIVIAENTPVTIQVNSGTCILFGNLLA